MKITYFGVKTGVKTIFEQANFHGLLTAIPVNSWMAFLHFMNMLRLGYAFAQIQKEVSAGYGNFSHNTFVSWRRIYQTGLAGGLETMDLRMIGGGKDEVAVIDETVVGINGEDGWSFETKGINKGGAKQTRKTQNYRTRQLVKKGILKRYPARTVYRNEKIQKHTFALSKKPASASAMKKAAVKKKPAAVQIQPNLKNNGRWLWLGVLVGKGSTVYTHANASKKIVYRLPPCKAEAKSGKPRGLIEMTATIQSCIRKGTCLVYDGWTSTDVKREIPPRT